MTNAEIGLLRLVSQQIAGPHSVHPRDIVQHLGALQAQDYLGSLWAVGLRTCGAPELAIEQALADRLIVRTWPMRGTIHLIPAGDVRWMLDLLTPRVIQGSQGRLRQLGLDSQIITRSAEIVAQALVGGKQLTRPELYAILETSGIQASSQRGLHILGQLAHRQLICFGARRGKQPTFTLLDEWISPVRPLPRDEALAMLAMRYFTGHG